MTAAELLQDGATAPAAKEEDVDEDAYAFGKPFVYLAPLVAMRFRPGVARTSAAGRNRSARYRRSRFAPSAPADWTTSSAPLPRPPARTPRRTPSRD
ncbi:hypothetical protein G6F50_016720 [Rhizopus delemar]|uniref:Uncharacterized protein n=1 Tax=Rhizopus delemar TaxID=936053 RepID=A0A9P6XS78_9FUNG|nr:hypothetical protein G6F50_016720 [Rhizopus delemar]